MRLDSLLVDKGLVTGRDKAKAVIMAGLVYVDGQKAEKAGTMFSLGSAVELRGETLPYVSRGGLKLEKALVSFPVSLKGKVCMDIGASTGGFTDCMLQNGAAKVYAVDVGYGQLAWKLRQDARVKVMERTNIRYVTPDDLGEPPGFASADVSFISLSLVLPVASNLLADGGEVICLIKPQFEAGRDKVGKKGVVRDPSIHREVITKIVDFAPQCGLRPMGLTYSPVRGPEGNIEYLLWLKKEPGGTQVSSGDICATVASSHDGS